MSVFYEWIVEEMTGPEADADIAEVYHEPSFRDAMRRLRSLTDAHVALVRDVEGRGGVDRSWAYLTDFGELPAVFLDAGDATTASVPRRFHAEVQRELRPAD